MLFLALFYQSCVFSVTSSRETKWFSWSKALSVLACFCVAVSPGQRSQVEALPIPGAARFAPFALSFQTPEGEKLFQVVSGTDPLLPLAPSQWPPLGLRLHRPVLPQTVLCVVAALPQLSPGRVQPGSPGSTPSCRCQGRAVSGT